jgi:hypothetical protein
MIALGNHDKIIIESAMPKTHIYPQFRSSNSVSYLMLARLASFPTDMSQAAEGQIT